MAGLDTWVEYVSVPWTSEDASGWYVEEIVHFQSYLRRLVVAGSVPVAARAASILLRHGGLAETTRTAIAQRFPEQEES